MKIKVKLLPQQRPNSKNMEFQTSSLHKSASYRLMPPSEPVAEAAAYHKGWYAVEEIEIEYSDLVAALAAATWREGDHCYIANGVPSAEVIEATHQQWAKDAISAMGYVSAD